MCGIAGYLDFSGKPLSDEKFEKMVSIMSHRGPDHQGVKAFKGSPYVLLGNRRLSVLDLSQAGNQPMFNKDGAVTIVHNGEVYNFKEIKNKLIKKGYRFDTDTDTEVIIQAYEEWGENCLDYFNGMFAFAIWDSHKRKLFIARDRLGEKPLYYSFVNGSIYFASEIKSILTIIQPEINMEGVEDFLSLQYVPWPNTAFKNIYKLPPAHYMTYVKKGFKINRYWKIPTEKCHVGYDQAKSRFFELLKDAVKLRLISDVPLGMFLSGGLDSSAVAYLARNLVNSPLKTYTIGFKEESQRFDESNYARIVAEHLDVENKVILCEADNAFEKIPRLIWNLDEPIAESLIYPLYELANNAKDEITVALSGEGSDEFLYGYRNYSFEKYRKAFPNFSFLNFSGKEEIHLRALGYCFSNSIESAFNNWVVCFNRFEMEKITGRKNVGRNFFSEMRKSLPIPPSQNMDVYPWIDQHFRMVDYILTSRDKMTMAASLELRVPFLDHRLVEFMSSLPWNYKIRSLKEKFILKDSFRRLLPKEITKRRKKPFSAPIHVWLKKLTREFLPESKLVKDGVLTNTIEDYFPFKDGKAVYPRKLWNILMLEIWYRIYFKGFLS